MPYTLTVITDDGDRLFVVEDGANLRQTLLDADLTPYTAITRVANCGGRGLCATCGIHFEAGEPAPVHWHDRLAARYGYPRLSCQITIDHDMTIRFVDDKLIWGAPIAARRFRPDTL